MHKITYTENFLQIQAFQSPCLNSQVQNLKQLTNKKGRHLWIYMIIFYKFENNQNFKNALHIERVWQKSKITVALQYLQGSSLRIPEDLKISQMPRYPSSVGTESLFNQHIYSCKRLTWFEASVTEREEFTERQNLPHKVTL